MIDSHAHLAMFPPEERSDVLTRATAAGVGLVLVPATGVEDLEVVAGVVAEFPQRTRGAFGFHPHEASGLDAAGKRRVTTMLESHGTVAVGEIGLDYYYENSPREDQTRAFVWQLELARERNLPVILHHRDAWDDFLACLDRVPGVRGVAHSFTEGEPGVVAMVARGLFVGISGMVTFNRAENVRDAARAVPIDRLLVETDSPFLAPVPFRGRRNEPAHVVRVAEAVAEVRGTSRERIEDATDRAFAALFGPIDATGVAPERHSQ